MRAIELAIAILENVDELGDCEVVFLEEGMARAHEISNVESNMGEDYATIDLKGE